MIITRNCLQEWIDIQDISTDKLCKIFNSIGLEVDSVSFQRMPKKVVIGKILEKNAHPDANKLSICKVDIGKEQHQIVCGAKNVDVEQYVAVALEGATLPDGLTIKPVSLRGIESNGMICSSTELGLPKINDGIMVLDDSIGELKVGKELQEYSLLNDDIIELELTANRGDCLSVHGVARDLSVALNKSVKKIPTFEEDDNLLGIGRIVALQTEDKLHSSLIYKAVTIDYIKENLLMDLRLALVDLQESVKIEALLNYAMYNTGVLFRAYDFDFFKANEEKITLHVKQDKDGFDGLYSHKELASKVGFSQEKSSQVTNETKLVIIEAGYTKPEVISKLAMMHKNLTPDKHYYRASRGSEPNLEFGIYFFDNLIKKESKVSPYGGFQKVLLNKDKHIINLEIQDIKNIIGQKVDKSTIVSIVQGIGCEISFKSEQDLMSIKVPFFRHDIKNKQDICEEVVRYIGIDNIQSKPYFFNEKIRINKSYLDYKKRLNIRYKSVAAGFYESIHYVFDDRQIMNKYDIVGIYKKRELSNPISNELSTLRATLALHLIKAVSFNTKNGKRQISLFESGVVYNQKREQSTKIAWIFSGEVESPNIANHGKPKMIDLMLFASKISSIVGDISLEADSPENKLFSPYEYANVMINSKTIGYIARIHAKVENEYDIMPTYLCELDFNLIPNDKKIACEYSKFPTSSRDLSFLVPKIMPYKEIKKVIESLKNENLINFYPIDKYENEELGDMMSLSIKLIFQDLNQTLEDEKVNSIIDSIIKKLDEKLQIKLR